MRDRLRIALTLVWVVIVLAAAATVIIYVFRGGAAEGMPERAQVSGALLAAVVVIPPAVSWAWRHRRRTGTARSVAALVWVLIVLAAAVTVIIYVGWNGAVEDMPDRAQVSGTLLAAVVVIPPTVSWAWRNRRRIESTRSTATQVAGAVSMLAQKTHQTWSVELLRRGIQTPTPVQVRWGWASTDMAVPQQELIDSPALSTDPRPLSRPKFVRSHGERMLNAGVITRLHDELYTGLRHGRLVIVGGAGAGKTGAMILLLVEALRQRDLARGSDQPPVPVWLTLGSWNPSTESVRDWVTKTMARDHPYLRAPDFGPDAIDQMFDSGLIALFLDGLDEMPGSARRIALQRLAAEAQGLRLTLTSRPDQYRSTLHDGWQLPFTAVVELQPVPLEAAAEYLLQDQVEPARFAWQQVTERMHADPAGVLARTLSTPLALSLARSMYVRETPTELLRTDLVTESALRGHLHDRFLATAYPDPKSYAHAARWLGWCAHQMSNSLTAPTRDLRWWEIPAWLSSPQAHLAGGLVGGGMGFLLGGLLGGVLGQILGDRGLGLLSGSLSALFAGLVFGLAAGLSSGSPRSVEFRRPAQGQVRQAVASLTLGLLIVIGIGLVNPIALVLGGPIAVAMHVRRFFNDVWNLPTADSGDVTPKAAFRKDVQAQLVQGALLGIVVGIPLGLFAGAIAWLENGLEAGLVTCIMVLLAVALVAGALVALLSGAAPRLLFTEIFFFIRGRGVRFMPLLHDALERQVLRQAGAVYQFRHADLQDRLAERYVGIETRKV